MKNSFWGYVIQANASNIDEPALEKHLRITKPELIHVLNRPAYAAHLKRNVVPDSRIYLRHYDADGDGNDWNQYSPVDYFNRYEADSMGGALGFQIAKEPGFGRDVTLRGVGFMLEGLKRKIPTEFGGFSVGTPPATPDGWAAHDDFLHLICQHPDLLSYSADEYFEVLPTSGMTTKDTKAGEQLYFTEHLARIDQWPKSVNDLDRMFHVGRCKAAADYCRMKGYGQLPIDITEHGADDVEGGAIKEWKNSLPNGPNIRGYKECLQVWAKMFPGYTRAQVFRLMLTWIRDVIYLPIGVKGAALFTWWNTGVVGSSQDWGQWDIATDPDMQVELESSAGATLPPPVHTPPADPPELPPAPLDPPLPANPGLPVNVRIEGDNWNMRREPTVKAAKIGTLVEGEEINLYPATATLADGQSWKMIERAFTVTGQARRGWSAYPTPAIPPSPTVQTFRIPLILSVEAATPEAANLLARSMVVAMDAKYRQLRYDTELLKHLDEITSASFSIEFKSEGDPV